MGSKCLSCNSFFVPIFFSKLETLVMRAAVDKTGPNANVSMHRNGGVTLEYQGCILDTAG